MLTSYDEKALSSIFSEKGSDLIKYLIRLEQDLPVYTYKFIPIEEYKQISNFAEAQKIYWFELIERAHWASITTIYRLLGWASGASNTFNVGNFLVFTAAYRGFLESSADSFYSLLRVPKAFATVYQPINSILNGQGPIQIAPYKDLEDILIHFSYARSTQTIKKNEIAVGEKFPSSHNAETIRKYIDSFGDGLREKVHDCYSYLCDTTHPGMSSVLMYVAKTEDGIKIRNFSDKHHFETSLLDSFCLRNEKMSEEILILVFNLSIITLKVINAFNIPEVYTPAVNNLSMNHTKLWQDIEKYIPTLK